MEQNENTLSVLKIAPGQYPQQVEIDNNLKALQEAVGGTIAAVYPFADPVAIICNDDGKLMGLPLNRALRDENGEMYDAKTYRSEAIGTVGSYIGLNLSVRSEYHYTGAFERNIFLVEGKSGLKYKCGLSGALPLGFADSAVYPQATLDKLPELIRRQQEKIDQLANELTTLQQIFSRKWGKTAELDALKQECKELQRKIDNSLKELEQQPAVTVIAA